METNTPESVSINMDVFDEPNKSAAPYIDNHCSNGKAVLSTNYVPLEARDLQATSSGYAGAGSSQGSAVDIEEIELIDMKCRVVEMDSSPRELLQADTQSPSKTRADCTQSSADNTQPGNSGTSLSPMQQLSNPGSPSRVVLLNDQALSSEGGILLSPVRQRSNPTSPHRTVSSNDQSKSTLSVPGQPWKHKTCQKKPKDRLRVGTAQNNDADDDDDEISMGSLLELLGTVRQYAKEIHEIYAPMKKDEEERIRKQNEQNARRKSKDKGKHLVCRSNSEATGSMKHEVRVEIHTPDHKPMEELRQKCSRQTKHEVLLHSRSHEPLPTNQTASLHVENEKLASTWPRGNRRATSRERFWSDVSASNQESHTSQGLMSRPQIPPSWSGISRARQKGDILGQTSRRSSKTGADPPAIALAKSNTSSQKLPARPHQTRETNPSVKDHRTLKQGLPQISIIPASFDYRTPCSESVGGSLPSALPENNTSSLRSASRGEDSPSGDIIPPAPVVAGNDRGIGRLPGPPPVGDDTAKSVSRAGLRKRKSVDKGLGHHVVVLEKY